MKIIDNTKEKKRKERLAAGKAYKAARDKAERLLDSKGKESAQKFTRTLRRKWEQSKSLIDKKAYDGAKNVVGPGFLYPAGDIDVLMITQNDWSNTGYRFSKCLEALGLKVVMVKGRAHTYKYTKEAQIDPALSVMRSSTFPWVIKPEGRGARRIRELMGRAKVVHFSSSTYTDVGADLSDKFVVVQHGGTTYRQHPAKSNNIFNKLVDATIIQCPDLLSLGAKNEHLIYYPVQTNLLVPNYDKVGSKILIGHFPSNPKNKGTSAILDVIRQLEKDPDLRGRFEYIGTKEVKKMGALPWKEHLKRVSKCDVLIETLNMKQSGKKFGEWGNTAIEAAALGKIVITNSQTRGIYKEEYGSCALHIANSKVKLKKKLIKILQMSDEEIRQEKIKTRAWVVKNHSMEANSKRLWEKVYCKFFPELENQVRSKFWK